MPSPLENLRQRNLANGKPAQLTGTQKGGLAGIVGALAATVLFASIPKDEGTVYVGYLDLVGIPTKCSGDTTGVVVGRHYTPEQCRQSLDVQLVKHAAPVMECTPGLRPAGRDYQRAAAVSLAYNIGPSAYCRSAVARKFNAGDIRGACNSFRSWVYAGGKVIPGLQNRRERERTLCLKGVS
jgi:lysozyme